MRKRFELQMSICQTPISEIYINPKSRNSLEQLIAALKAIYCNAEYRVLRTQYKYNNEIFNIIESYLPKVNRHNGRPCMNLWTIFVLSQVRMCLGTSYDMLHHLSNNDLLLRQLLGISDIFGKESIRFEYQNIYDNVSKLSDAMLREITGAPRTKHYSN